MTDTDAETRTDDAGGFGDHFAPSTSVRREAWTLLPPVVVLLAGFIVATGHGAGRRELVAVGVALIVTQVLPGICVWRCLRPSGGWLVEDVVVGAAIGAGLGVLAHVGVLMLGNPQLGWLPPMLLMATLLALPSTRARIRTAGASPPPRWWGPVVALASVPSVLAAVRSFSPIRWEGWATPYVDTPFHLALAGEVSAQWPVSYPNVAGEALTYHWLSYAWVGHIGNISGTELEVVLVRVLPLLVAVLVPLGVAVVSLRVTNSVNASALATIVTFVLVEVDWWDAPNNALPLLALSPSHGFSLLVMIGALSLVVMRWRSTATWGSAVCLLLLLFVAGGAKGSTLLVISAGLVGAAMCALLWRSPSRRVVIVDAGLSLFALLLVSATVFGGADAQGGDRAQALDPFGGLARSARAAALGDAGWSGNAATTGAVVLTVLTLTLGSAAALAAVRPAVRAHDVVVAAVAAMAVAGLLAVVVLDFPIFENWYFWRAGELALGVLAGAGLARMSARLSRPALVALLAGVVGLLSLIAARVLVTTVSFPESVPYPIAVAAVSVLLVVTSLVVVSRVVGDEQRRSTLLFMLAVACAAFAVPAAVRGDPHQMPAEAPALASVFGPAWYETGADDSSMRGFHSDQVAAARWIRSHTEAADLVVSNRHCRVDETDGCDVRRFFVAAYSERSVVVEGWAYTRSSTATAVRAGEGLYRPAFTDPQLLALNDRFIRDPNPADARSLYRLGVRMVFIDVGGIPAGDLRETSVLRFDSPRAQVWELRPTG